MTLQANQKKRDGENSVRKCYTDLGFYIWLLVDGFTQSSTLMISMRQSVKCCVLSSVILCPQSDLLWFGINFVYGVTSYHVYPSHVGPWSVLFVEPQVALPVVHFVSCSDS